LSGLGHDGLEFDGSQSAKGGLASSTVVGPFDPGDDCDPELFAGVPAAAVQHVFLQQAKETLHGGVVGGRCDLAHRSDHPVSQQCLLKFSGSKLTASVAVKDAAHGLLTCCKTSCHSTAERIDRQRGLHPLSDGITHDPVGPHVLDRADIQLALARLDSSSRRNGRDQVAWGAR
jgi:hypothetical protein